MNFYKSNLIQHIIIVVQNKSITPDYRRKPTDDVVLYVPLENDIAEKTWKNTITNYWITIQTVWWISAWYFNWSSRIETSQHQFSNTSHTLSARVYYPASWFTTDFSIICSNPCWIFNWDVLAVWQSWTKLYYISYYQSSRSRAIEKTWLNLKWTRHNILFSWWILYLDWQQVWTWSWSYGWNQIYTLWWHTTNSSCTRWFWQWHAREVIISNTVWNATTVLEYYNKTKKMFWIT